MIYILQPIGIIPVGCVLLLRSLHKGLNANLYQCHSLMEWIYNRTGNRDIENVMVKIQNF